MNNYNPNIHHRKSIRLKGYDYTQAGLYFITICVKDRECLFGKIMNGKINLNDAGIMIENEWLKIPDRFPNVQLHQHVIMPNHFHAIMEIMVGATLVVAHENPVTHEIPVAHENPVTHEIPVAHENPVTHEIPVAHENPVTHEIPVAHENDTDVNNGAMGKRATTRVAPTVTVGGIIGAFQSIVTVEYIRGVKNHDWQPFKGKLWQRNYYEHIIRNEQSYDRIADYIINNPENWKKDNFF